jgi:hypothetical protein
MSPRPEKLTPTLELAQSGVREIIFAAFNELGGLDGLVKWGRKNPEKFYQLWVRCGPRFEPGKPGQPSANRASVLRVKIPGFNSE